MGTLNAMSSPVLLTYYEKAPRPQEKLPKQQQYTETLMFFQRIAKWALFNAFPWSKFLTFGFSPCLPTKV